MEVINGYFVASKIFESTTFKSNNDNGYITHNVKVSKKKYLIYSTIDENGVIRYYEYGTEDQTMNKSFTNQANNEDVDYFSYMDNFGFGRNNRMKTRFKKTETKYGFFMPLNDYIKMNIPFYNPTINSPFKAQAIVKFLNGISVGNVKLNENADKAHKQLENIGCYKKEKIKVKTNDKKETYAKVA